MGKKAAEALKISYNELDEYLHINHSVYMRFGTKVYYITDAGENYWRAQDTSIRNHKNHFVDCSELVPTVGEFLSLRFANGHTIEEIFDQATFYASEKGRE
ncbi:MAG: CDP-alcohol phosphatidyltransferase [Coriobacteriales bacterium]|nr:CDP-alcohol phosphatidyltransferase [Coriobacteriales bacterium]